MLFNMQSLDGCKMGREKGTHEAATDEAAIAAL